MYSNTSKLNPRDMKIHENCDIKNIKYRKCFYLPFTRHAFYQMMALPRLRGNRDLSRFASSTEWADRDEGVVIIISIKNTL